MSSKTKTALFVVLLILDVLFLLALIITEIMSYEITSTVIDSSFLKSAKELYILSTIRGYSLVSCIAITVAFLCVMFQKTRFEEPEWKLILLAVMAFVVALIMVVKAIVDLVPAVSNEPVLRMSVITQTDSDYSRRSGWSYYLIIEGQKITVTEEEYKSTKKGDPYYIICYGDKIIETCNPKKYTCTTDSGLLTEPE